MYFAERLTQLGKTKQTAKGQATSRSAFGVAQIPLGACVEIELIAQVSA